MLTFDACGKRCPEVVLAARDAMHRTSLCMLKFDDPKGLADLKVWLKRVKTVAIEDERLEGVQTMYVTLRRRI